MTDTAALNGARSSDPALPRRAAPLKLLRDPSRRAYAAQLLGLTSASVRQTGSQTQGRKIWRCGTKMKSPLREERVRRLRIDCLQRRWPAAFHAPCGEWCTVRSSRPLLHRPRPDGDSHQPSTRRKAGSAVRLVTDALVMAIWRRGNHGIVCSMSRSGNVWDNAAMESFFSSLKTERTARKTYRTRDEAKADVFDYIECFYNVKRRHSTISHLSPMEFENRMKCRQPNRVQARYANRRGKGADRRAPHASRRRLGLDGREKDTSP